ncbi:MAG TPA: hypothetical protein VEN82_03230 [Actinomycetota bacterium]|nr:hypothetical protein [Actinomycetota bacterium]
MTVKKWISIGVAVLAAFALAIGPTALASTNTYYVGRTSPGNDLLFSIQQDNHGNTSFVPDHITAQATCATTGGKFKTEFLFFGFQIPLFNGNRFRLAFKDPFELFSWSGKASPTGASGSVQMDFPSFTPGGGLADCGTQGQIPWRALAVGSGSDRSPTAADYTVTLTKDGQGVIHVQVTHQG